MEETVGAADDNGSFQSLSTDDAYNEGYGCGYEQGCDDAASGNSYGNGYDDYNGYSYQLNASYCQGYADGYDDGYSKCEKDGWIKRWRQKRIFFHTITSWRGVIPINMCKFVCE